MKTNLKFSLFAWFYLESYLLTKSYNFKSIINCYQYDKTLGVILLYVFINMTKLLLENIVNFLPF